MKRSAAAVLIVVLACTLLCPFATAAEKAVKKGPMVAHNVFFSLKDSSPAARQALVDDCHKLLAPIPGMVFYAAGALAEDMKRDINDRDFDVCLTCIFKNKAALDAYAVAPPHLQFIEKHKASWKKVRVFDAYVAAAPKAD
jgi:hypothetical protein